MKQSRTTIDFPLGNITSTLLHRDPPRPGVAAPGALSRYPSRRVRACQANWRIPAVLWRRRAGHQAARGTAPTGARRDAALHGADPDKADWSRPHVYTHVYIRMCIHTTARGGLAGVHDAKTHRVHRIPHGHRGPPHRSSRISHDPIEIFAAASPASLAATSLERSIAQPAAAIWPAGSAPARLW